MDLISNAIADGSLAHNQKENQWINILKEDILAISEDESESVEMVMPTIDSCISIPNE